MSLNSHLPKSIADLLAATPAVSDADLNRLKKSGEEIERDPQSRAEIQKSLFVNAILAALKKEGITKSELARRMKRARQYINSILDEDSSVNFTIETLSIVAAACNRRAEIVVLADDEWVKVQKSIPESCFSGFSERNFLPIANVYGSSIVYSLNIRTEIPQTNNITTHDFSTQTIVSKTVKVA